jgi:UDP-N-acetylglucosamine 2-epimerase (non-hydrolysing)
MVETHALHGKIMCVVGARPNFMKIAPVMVALKHISPPIDLVLVHTGQHYDAAMNDQHFADLGIPAPDINLEVGSGTHAVQTAEVMRRFEPVLDDEAPSILLVVGDVNSTLACALVAAKKGIFVVHVEAGLRSRDRTMPEEINRLLTDQISDLLLTTERSAADNLMCEGIDESRIHFVGNVMIDTLRNNLPRAISAEKTIRLAGDSKNFPAGSKQFAILTLHRPSNVDDPQVLRALLETIGVISVDLPVLFPVHPRTREKIERFGLMHIIENSSVLLLPPVGYLEMLGLMKDARLVLTDSGGIQEETTALGVPCITLRNNTERPITVTEGTNTITGQNPEKILATYREVMATGGKAGRVPEFWDGHAADRIAVILRDWLAKPKTQTEKVA